MWSDWFQILTYRIYGSLFYIHTVEVLQKRIPLVFYITEILGTVAGDAREWNVTAWAFRVLTYQFLGKPLVIWEVQAGVLEP